MSLGLSRISVDFVKAQAGFYFRNWEYSFDDAQKPLTVTLGLILFFCLLYLLYALYRRRFRGPAVFTQDDPENTKTVIGQSIAERATYEVQFDGKGRKRLLFSCAPIKLLPEQGIVLELSGFIHPQQDWVGRWVHCHFRVATGKKDQKWLFYQFKSSIVAVDSRHGQDQITVALPRQLKQKQRRQHLRLEPSSADIPSLSIWPETFANLDNPQQHPPMLSFVHGLEFNQLIVLNISAGGMLLEIRSPALQTAGESLDKGKRFFIQIFLRSPDQDAETEYMFTAQVRNAFNDPTSGNAIIGISFSAYQVPSSQDPKTKKWVPLHGKGVEAIEDWVFKRHLELYRQKGIT